MLDDFCFLKLQNNPATELLDIRVWFEMGFFRDRKSRLDPAGTGSEFLILG